MQQFLNDAASSDATVTIGSKKQKYSIHKLVFAAKSKFFYTLFFTKQQNHLDWSMEIQQDDFEHVQKYFYGAATCSEFLTSENVVAIYILAKKYMILELESTCTQYLKDHLNVENFCNLMDVVQNDEQFEQAMYSYGIKNLEQISKTEEFGKWNEKRVHSFLAKCGGTSEQEVVKFRVINNFVTSKKEQQMEIAAAVLNKLVSCIELGRIPVAVLLQEVLPSNLFTVDDISKAIGKLNAQPLEQ